LKLIFEHKKAAFRCSKGGFFIPKFRKVTHFSGEISMEIR